MSIKSISDLLQDIDQEITANGNGEITGPTMNNILRDMTNTLSEEHFRFPVDPALTTSAIGKVVMNDGSGVAKLYQFASATSAQGSKWIINSDDVANEYDSSGLYGMEEYAIHTIDFSGTTTGDTFEVYFGSLLFTLEIAASQDNANYQAATDPDPATYRTNIISAINAYNSNSGNNFITAYDNPDDTNKIDIVTIGNQAVLIGQGNFQSESGGFTAETFTPYGSSLIFETDSNGNATITSNDWRGVTTPVTPLEELELLRDYINNNPAGIPTLNNFTASIDSNDQLILEEDTFDKSKITLNDWSGTDLTVEILGHEGQPAAPSALPLGRLVGIDGSDALISHRYIETYPLEAPITLNQDFFNAGNNINLNDQTLEDILNLIIIPSENANARPITEDDLVVNQNDLLPGNLRHNCLGIAINATANNVTVLNTPILFNFANHLIKILAKTGQLS